MSGFTTFLGILPVIGGVLDLAGMEGVNGAILLIVLGGHLILKPWFRNRQPFGKAEVGQSRKNKDIQAGSQTEDLPGTVSWKACTSNLPMVQAHLQRSFGRINRHLVQVEDLMLEVEIIVQACIDKEWGEWLGGLVMTYPESDQTVLTGILPDQAAVYGVISHLRDLGIPLSTVRIEAFIKDDGCVSNMNGEQSDGYSRKL